MTFYNGGVAMDILVGWRVSYTAVMNLGKGGMGAKLNCFSPQHCCTLHH